jgi:L-ascorbate metabolism protein UlaG (beta-lactamase superfamily)
MKRLYPLRKNGRFYQSKEAKHQTWFFSTIMLLLESLKRGFWSTEKKEAKQWCVQSLKVPSISKQPTFTWLGHATFLIQVGGKNILTDPILGNLSWIFSRIMPLKIKVDQLPCIDYIVISHNHPDHMDDYTLRAIIKAFPQVRILVPMGDKAWFESQGFDNVSECMWWDEIIDESFKFTFLPAFHWSQRSLFDKNKSLWGSWMIEYKDFKFYFAGDTSWGSHFKMIGKIFKSIDVAFMPIGPGEPRQWMQESHINAEEAGKAFLQLNARQFVPMHWGTFHLGFDAFSKPLQRIQAWWLLHKKACKEKILTIVKVGQFVQCIPRNVTTFVKQSMRTPEKTY